MTDSPRIIVLDGYTLSPGPGARGDVDWGELAALGALELHERSGDLRVERAAGASIVLTNKEVFDSETIRKLPALRYIGVLATGVDVVDLDAARAQGITVTNIPAYSTPSVAQHVFALLLEIVSHTSLHTGAVMKGEWQVSDDFMFTRATLRELAGKNFGIVGLGSIGSAVARIAAAFGMNVLAAESPSGRRPAIAGVSVKFLPLDELFVEADIVSLHCPLNLQTEGLVNATRLASMRSDAVLLNTGRGPLIDERALRESLDAGHLAGAGLDVLSQEAPPADHPLLGAPRCHITPHLAWATWEARQRLMAIATSNVRQYLLGSSQNVVT